MKKIIDFFKEDCKWAYLLVSTVIVLVSATICHAIDDPTTQSDLAAVYGQQWVDALSGIGVWLSYAFVTFAYFAVMSRNMPKARSISFANLIGAIIGGLAALVIFA